MNNENRWKQLFENFEKAFQVFQRRIDAFKENPTDEAFQMSLIQSFEIILELSWNTFKDYMENQSLDCENFPKAIISKAFSAELISSPEDWMASINIRNKTSHAYKENILEEVTTFIQQTFYPLVRDLYFTLKKEL